MYTGFPFSPVKSNVLHGRGKFNPETKQLVSFFHPLLITGLNENPVDDIDDELKNLNMENDHGNCKQGEEV